MRIGEHGERKVIRGNACTAQGSLNPLPDEQPNIGSNGRGECTNTSISYGHGYSIPVVHPRKQHQAKSTQCDLGSHTMEWSHSFHSDSKSEACCSLHPRVRMRSNRCPLCAATIAKKKMSSIEEKDNGLSDAPNEFEEEIKEFSLDPKWAEALRKISIRLANEKAMRVDDSQFYPNDDQDDKSVSSFATPVFTRKFAESKEHSHTYYRQDDDFSLPQKIEMLSPSSTKFVGTELNLFHSLDSDSSVTLLLASGHRCTPSAIRLQPSPPTSTAAPNNGNSPIGITSIKAQIPNHNHDEMILQEVNGDSDDEISLSMEVPTKYSEAKYSSPISPISAIGIGSPSTGLDRQETLSPVVDLLNENRKRYGSCDNGDISSSSLSAKNGVILHSNSHPSFISALVHNVRCRSHSSSRRTSSHSKSRGHHTENAETERSRLSEKERDKVKENGRSSPPHAPSALAQAAEPQLEECKTNPQAELQPVVVASPENEQQCAREPFTHPLYKLGDIARYADMVVLSTSRRHSRSRRRRRSTNRIKSPDSMSSERDNEEYSHWKEFENNVILQTIGQLRHLDAAFILRSDGRWTYAVVADWTDKGLRFVVDDRGSTKVFSPEQLNASVRRVRVLTQRRGDRLGEAFDAIKRKPGRKKRSIGRSRSFRRNRKGQLVSPSPTRSRNQVVLNLPPTIIENKQYN